MTTESVTTRSTQQPHPTAEEDVAVRDLLGDRSLDATAASVLLVMTLARYPRSANVRNQLLRLHTHPVEMLPPVLDDQDRRSLTANILLMPAITSSSAPSTSILMSVGRTSTGMRSSSRRTRTSSSGPGRIGELVQGCVPVDDGTWSWATPSGTPDRHTRALAVRRDPIERHVRAEQVVETRRRLERESPARRPTPDSTQQKSPDVGADVDIHVPGLEHLDLHPVRPRLPAAPLHELTHECPILEWGQDVAERCSSQHFITKRESVPVDKCVGARPEDGELDSEMTFD